MTKTIRLVLGGLIALVLVVSAGTFVYIHDIEGSPPKQLSIDATATTTTAPGALAAASTADLTGTWKPTTASQVGYRVKENLFGQSNTAVGRTHNVTGTMTMNGSSIASVDLVVDMTTVSSDQARRDGQFKGRIMDVSTYPTSEFKLTSPITLPSTSGTVTVKAAGDLTLHGKTKSVTTDISAVRDGDTIKASGSIPIVFANYGIPNPTFATVSTEDHGTLEFLVVFQRS